MRKTSLLSLRAFVVACGLGTVVLLQAALADPPLPRHDGRQGAICRWGERRPGNNPLNPGAEGASVYPTPKSCKAGLKCCAAGGAYGSDSVCMRTRQCPAYP